MSLPDRELHITVHPRCVGRCRQVKEPQDVIVKDEHGNRGLNQARLSRIWLTNCGLPFPQMVSLPEVAMSHAEAREK